MAKDLSEYCKLCLTFTNAYEMFDIAGGVVVCDDCIDVIRGDNDVFIRIPPKAEQKFKLVADDREGE